MILFRPGPALAIGYPAFNIDSWSIPQGALTNGDVFDLTLTFSNVGTFGANEVLVEVEDDGNFTGLGTSPRFGHMGIGAQVTTTITVGISQTIEDGFYGIPVKFSYHHSALGGERRTDIRTIGVDVDGLSPFSGDSVAQGEPRLVISESAVDEDPASGTVFVTLALANTGSITATNIVLNLDESEVFVPAEGTSSASQVGQVIQPGEETKVTVPLNVLASPEGRVDQAFTLEYSSYVGGSFSSTQRVPIILQSITGEAPRLLLEGYTAEPEPVTPGSIARLTLRVANVGNGDAQRVFIRLGDDAANLGPLAPVGSSNVLYLEEVPAGNRVEIGYDLAAAGDAEAGIVSVDVKLAYESAFGVSQEETFTISLRVDAVPQLDINLFGQVPPITVGSTVEIPIEVINIGTTQVNVSTIEVESDILTITEGSQYIGPLDGGTSGSLIATAQAQQAGTATVVVTVNYLDSFGQQQTFEGRLTFEVMGTPGDQEQDEGAAPAGPVGAPGASPVPEEEADPPTLAQRIMRGVLGFFGLGTRGA